MLTDKVFDWFNGWSSASRPPMKSTNWTGWKARFTLRRELFPGVPQGTFFGPLMFWIFVNYLPINLISRTSLCADDSVLYRSINSFEDHILLQKDPKTLSQWAEDWQMQLEPSKYYSFVTTLKKQPSVFTYSMLGSNLTQVASHKYLGVYITSNLSWSRHCNKLRSKAKRVLGILQRNLSECSKQIEEHAYLCLVRPKLEYITSTWSTYTQKI